VFFTSIITSKKLVFCCFFVFFSVFRVSFQSESPQRESTWAFLLNSQNSENPRARPPAKSMSMPVFSQKRPFFRLFRQLLTKSGQIWPNLTPGGVQSDPPPEVQAGGGSRIRKVTRFPRDGGSKNTPIWGG
jgi:hypothetical protein